jgi:hypothetical protein
MPAPQRTINDVPTQSFIRRVIRYILNQEVRRLLEANASVQSDVATNTSNISANANAISANTTLIEDSIRRFSI